MPVAALKPLILFLTSVAFIFIGTSVPVLNHVCYTPSLYQFPACTTAHLVAFPYPPRAFFTLARLGLYSFLAITCVGPLAQPTCHFLLRPGDKCLFLSVCPTVCLSLPLYSGKSSRLTFCLPLSVCLSTPFTYITLSVCVSFSPFPSDLVCLLVHMPVCLFICVSV